MSGRRIEVDLHGYDVVSALEYARTRVGDAWSNGYGEVELLHGAADVEQPVEEGRGRIKWALRRMVEEGAFAGWADASRIWLRKSSIVLRLKPNPRPRREAWGAEPPRKWM